MATNASLTVPQGDSELNATLIHPPWCRIYASTNRVIIGSDNGLWFIRRQAIMLKPMLGYCQLHPYEQTQVKL